MTYSPSRTGDHKVDRNLDQIASELNNVSSGATWVAVTFAGGWANTQTSLGWEVAAYRKDVSGLVTVKGLVISSNSLPSVIFTLPPDYRPAEHFLRVTAGNASGVVYYTLKVTTDGNVFCFAGAGAPSTYMALDFSFYAKGA